MHERRISARKRRVYDLLEVSGVEDGLARAVRPIHTPFDGDSIFALSTAAPDALPVDTLTLAVLGTLAADLVARATRRAVFG